MPRRALVLTGNLGMGHQMVGAVVTASLARLGWEVEVLDGMRLLGPLAGRAGDWTFGRIMAVPTLYDGLHFAHLRPGSRLAAALDRSATSRLLPALRGELERRPVDLVVSVFPTAASAVAKLRSEPGGQQPRAVVLCTDVTPHRLWVREGIDLFLVTSQAAAAAVRRYVPRAPIGVVPPPVRAPFYAVPAQGTARERLGIPPGSPCALVMGGGWGLGPLAGAAASLAGHGVQVLAVAGHNAKLARSLREVARREPTVQAFGHTDEIPLLMAAADVVVTTPGATTCSEARVVGRPLVLLDVVPGHGRDNVQHELELGDAEVCDPERVAASVVALLERVERPAPARLRNPAEWDEAFAQALAAISAPATGGHRDSMPREALRFR